MELLDRQLELNAAIQCSPGSYNMNMSHDIKRRWWMSTGTGDGRAVVFAQTRDGGINIQFEQLEVWSEISQEEWETGSGRATDELKELEFYYCNEEDEDVTEEWESEPSKGPGE